jgi:hypothetical protein
MSTLCTLNFFANRLLQKFSEELERGRLDEAKTISRQFLSLLSQKKSTIGYPHLAFEAGSHALTCLLWKLHGSSLQIEDEDGGGEGTNEEANVEK